MRNKTITYAIDGDTGLIVSRVGDQIAYGVLDFESMTQATNYETHYNLEKGNVFDVLPNMKNLKWTRKIPLVDKNTHRLFWNMKSLNK